MHLLHPVAHVAELADAYDSGSYGVTRGGSSPLVSTILCPDIEKKWNLNLPKKIRSSCEAPSLRLPVDTIWQITCSVAGWILSGEPSWRGLWQRVTRRRFWIWRLAVETWHWRSRRPARPLGLPLRIFVCRCWNRRDSRGSSGWFKRMAWRCRFRMDRLMF